MRAVEHDHLSDHKTPTVNLDPAAETVRPLGRAIAFTNRITPSQRLARPHRTVSGGVQIVSNSYTPFLSKLHPRKPHNRTFRLPLLSHSITRHVRESMFTVLRPKYQVSYPKAWYRVMLEGVP